MSAGDTHIAAAVARPWKERAKPSPTAWRGVGFWLIVPAVLAVLVVSVVPLAVTLFLSLREAPSGFEALAADPRFWEALRRTLTVAAIALPVELVLGFILAVLFTGPMPGKAVFVSLMALPALTAPVVAGSAWRILFNNDYGPVNHVLSLITGRAVMTLWTEQPDFALAAVVIADVWQWTPFTFVLLLAALTHVGRGQLEIASIDNAGPWRMLLSIVWPAVWPAIVIAVVVRGLDLLRLFDVVWVLTRGGPDTRTETLSVFAYDRLLQGADMAGTAALAFVGMLAVSLVATLVLVGLGRER